MKLIQGLQKLNFPQEQIDRLAPLMEAYIKELRLFNSAYNLVNTDDREEIVVRHILDSLSAWQQIAALADERQKLLADQNGAGLSDAAQSGASQAISIADIGSGGGLPGIPLAAALPQYNFTLIERMSKRCAFLQNAAAILGLKNVQVQNLELEKTPAASIDIATFRAFRPLDKKMLKSLLAVLKADGVLAAYKARRSKILEEMGALGYTEQAADCDSANGDESAAASFAPGSPNESRVYKIIPLDVPFLTDTNSGDDRERNLVILKA